MVAMKDLMKLYYKMVKKDLDIKDKYVNESVKCNTNLQLKLTLVNILK